jgi:hypothetical protein
VANRSVGSADRPASRHLAPASAGARTAAEIVSGSVIVIAPVLVQQAASVDDRDADELAAGAVPHRVALRSLVEVDRPLGIAGGEIEQVGVPS